MSAALADSTVTKTLPPGGSVSLDAPGTAPTPDNPIVVTVYNPETSSSNAKVTITKRTTPTAKAEASKTILGSQHDISIKALSNSGDPLQNAQGYATFDLDASLFLPGFFGYPTEPTAPNPDPADPAHQIVIPGVGFNSSNGTAAKKLPNGDIRYYGSNIGIDQQTHMPAHVISYLAQRSGFGVTPFTPVGNSPADVRSHGFKIIGHCAFACEVTLTAKVGQKTASVLGLKSRVIAKRTIEQRPTSTYKNRKTIHYMLPLNSVAKAALKDVPKSVKSIKYGVEADVSGPSGVKVIPDRFGVNRPARSSSSCS